MSTDNQQLNSWITQLIRENQILQNLNRQLMEQLDLHVEANKNLLDQLKECRGDKAEDKEMPDGKNKFKDFKVPLPMRDLV
jgi:23S rRNA A1618 N6-methylase RlmF